LLSGVVIQAFCLRSSEGEAFTYLRSLLIMALPLMVSAAVGAWYSWNHFTTIGCKADPSLFYVQAAKKMARTGGGERKTDISQF
jgi:hypothetical protein